MGRKKYTAKLNEYAGRSGLKLTFEFVSRSCDGQRVIMRAVISGQEYAGVGETEWEARQNAAKYALRSLDGKENHGPEKENAENPPAKIDQKGVRAKLQYDKTCGRKTTEVMVHGDDGALARPSKPRKPLDICNDKLNRMVVTSDSPSKPKFQDIKCPKEMDPGNGPREEINSERVIMRAVTSGQEHPVGVGKNAWEAKKSAARGLATENVAENVENPPAKVDQKRVRAKLQYDETCGRKTTEVMVSSDDGASAGPSKPQTALDICNDKLNRMVVTSDSPSKPKVQDIKRPKEMDPGNSPCEETNSESNKSRFDWLETLGKGGYGRVVKVMDKKLKKYYAMKIVPYKENALREVKALSDLNHCNIVRYYNWFIEDSVVQSDSTDDSSGTSQSSGGASVKYLYIQMELCNAETLREWIDKKNMKESPKDSKRREESLNIILQIVSGVEYIHSKKFIHRDLKPTNIMFDRDGKVKIGDFGLVTSENDEDGNQIERTARRGTPSYMAPEQKSERTYDRKVDIYPLGLIYLELLWKISTYHEKVAMWDDIRRQQLPKGFEDSFTEEYIIIKPMLRAKPEDRPEATKIKADLDECTHKITAREIERRGSRTM